jgi:predicted phage-related endonuclease
MTTQGKPWRHNSDCIYYNIKTHSPEWHAFRMRGFGASEIGVVTGASEWKVLPQLIEEKAGLRTDRVANESVIGGTLAEAGILRRWKHWDGNGKSWVENYFAGKIVREMTQFNGYMTNNKYPNLFTSTDGWPLPNSVNLVTGEPMPIGFPIEAKTISGFNTDKWVSGVPPQYIFQANQEMMIFGVDYCEFAMLKNGVEFEVIPLELSPKIVEIILERSEDAWNTVLMVRELAAKKEAAPYHEKERIQSQIDSYLPLPDENPLYKEFYSDKFQKQKELEEMPQEIYEMALSRVKLSAAAKEIDAEISAFENNIRREFALRGTEYLDAGSDGRLRYYIRGNGKNHTLDFAGFKAKPKGDALEEIKAKAQELVKKVLLNL